MVDAVKARFDVGVEHPLGSPIGRVTHGIQGLVCVALRAEPVTARQELTLEYRLQDQLRRGHHDTVADRGDRGFIVRLLSGVAGLGDPVGGGDALSAGLLDVVWEGDAPASGAVAVPVELAVSQPVVDDVDADTKAVGDGVDGQLVVLPLGGVGVAVGQLP